MKKRSICFVLFISMNGCVNHYPNDFYTKQTPAAPATDGRSVQQNSNVGSSSASSIDSYKSEIAARISQINANLVYQDNPQAMLRAVIVVHYVLDADGRLLKAGIVRSNQDKVAENTALASLKNSAPFPSPSPRLLKGGRFDASETWLFDDDGRFQLRSIALPQRTE